MVSGLGTQLRAAKQPAETTKDVNPATKVETTVLAVAPPGAGSQPKALWVKEPSEMWRHGPKKWEARGLAHGAGRRHPSKRLGARGIKKLVQLAVVPTIGELLLPFANLLRSYVPKHT